MKIIMHARVLDIREYETKKYVTCNDAIEGGQVKLTFDSSVDGLHVDALLDLDVEVKPGIGKFGQYLEVKKINKKGV